MQYNYEIFWTIFHADAELVLSSPRDVSVVEGGNLTISCDAQRQTTVTWFRNGVEINQTNPRFNGSRDGLTSDLNIVYVSRFDEGRYKCRATEGNITVFSNESALIVNCK